MCAPLANTKRLQISIKLAEPKPFNGNTTQACAELSILKCYFFMVDLTYTATKAADTEAACQYAVVLMASNAVRYMNRLEVQSHALDSFPEFQKFFLN